MTAMKILRQFIFTTLAVAGLALGVSAQKHDQQKPPKEPPPKIVPGEGKKPPPPPKGGPKKPGMSFFVRDSGSEQA
jgi:hypothetical protein